MFGVVEGFHSQVCAIQRLRTGGRREVFNVILRLCLCGKSAESIFGHVRRGVPKGQSDRASLKDAQVAVSDLKSSGVTGGTIESHSCSICGTTRVEGASITKAGG